MAEAGAGPGGSGVLLPAVPATADAWGATNFPLRLSALPPCAMAVGAPLELADTDFPCQRDGCSYLLGYDTNSDADSNANSDADSDADANAPQQLFMFSARLGALAVRATPLGNSTGRPSEYPRLVAGCGLEAVVPQSTTRGGFAGANAHRKHHYHALGAAGADACAQGRGKRHPGG